MNCLKWAWCQVSTFCPPWPETRQFLNSSHYKKHLCRDFGGHQNVLLMSNTRKQQPFVLICLQAPVSFHIVVIMVLKVSEQNCHHHRRIGLSWYDFGSKLQFIWMEAFNVLLPECISSMRNVYRPKLEKDEQNISMSARGRKVQKILTGKQVWVNL